MELIPYEQRLANRKRDVLDYVRGHPCCTAREVAVHVFGGTGATRTSPRATAYHTLRRLEAEGLVACDRTANTHTWEAVACESS